MAYTIHRVDGFEPLDTGISANKYGEYRTFSEAKAALLESADLTIWQLREFKRDIKSTSKKDLLS